MIAITKNTVVSGPYLRSMCCFVLTTAFFSFNIQANPIGEGQKVEPVVVVTPMVLHPPFDELDYEEYLFRLSMPEPIDVVEQAIVETAVIEIKPFTTSYPQRGIQINPMH